MQKTAGRFPSCNSKSTEPASCSQARPVLSCLARGVGQVLRFHFEYGEQTKTRSCLDRIRIDNTHDVHGSLPLKRIYFLYITYIKWNWIDFFFFWQNRDSKLAPTQSCWGTSLEGKCSPGMKSAKQSNEFSGCGIALPDTRVVFLTFKL